MPAGPADPFYGYDDANAALDGCRARIHGTPGFGLAGSGLDQGRAAAGIMGERSLACALRHYGLLDDPDVDAFFSLRNPGDESGRADIDCVLAKGNLILLLDAKRYTPFTSDLMLMPSADDPLSASGPVDLRVLSYGLLEGRDTIGALSDLASACKYSASGNMRWALESTRKLLPGRTVGAWVLLTRTPARHVRRIRPHAVSGRHRRGQRRRAAANAARHARTRVRPQRDGLPHARRSGKALSA